MLPVLVPFELDDILKMFAVELLGVLFDLIEFPLGGWFFVFSEGGVEFAETEVGGAFANVGYKSRESSDIEHHN